MGNIIKERQERSDQRFELLKTELAESEQVCSGKACVYATGSFGRREGSKFSDIDLFIVSLGEKPEDANWLSNLDAILIKADLVRATKKLGFPAFSKDGKFLERHTAHRLIAATGQDDDDAINTFTARLLLLLESCPLVGIEVHTKLVEDVIARYWREFSDHYDHFMPAYLANDVLRYWRTLCLNYEARTSEYTDKDKAKRKIANYKLKHSRMLTCYSALLFLLEIYVQKGSVDIESARKLVSLTPTARVEYVAAQDSQQCVKEAAAELLGLYEAFLLTSCASEDDLIALFSQEEERKRLRKEQSKFGDLVYEMLDRIGKGNRFYRRLVV